ncbi:MAG: Gfo/Idh/MocA family oxidoreductase, partial [Rhizobiaceae bacterium]
HDGGPDWWNPIEAKTLIAGSSDPLQEQVLHFARVIRGEEEPVVSGVQGLRSLQVVEAVQRAADTGKAVEIEPLQLAEIAG